MSIIHAFPWLAACFVGDITQHWRPRNVHYVLAQMGVAADTSIFATIIRGAEKGKHACIGDSVAAADMETTVTMPTISLSLELSILCPSSSVVISPVTDAGLETTASTHMMQVLDPLEDDKLLQVGKSI